jgi:hypothetical protein
MAWFWPKVRKFFNQILLSILKNIKPSVLGLAITLIVASCSKKDVYNETADQSSTVTSAESVNANIPDWHSASQWDSVKQDKHAVFYFSMADSRITSDVVTDGLVLVYKKNNSTTVTLPFKEVSGNTATNWYHQVTEGNVLIFSDNSNDSNQPGAGNSFSLIVIAPDQLKSLASNGHTPSSLMDMTYEQVSKLLSSGN